MDKKLLACPNCTNVLNEPVTMPCGHHICTSCMQTLAEGRNQFKCPDCGTTVPMAKCIPNHLLHKLIHELSSVRIPKAAPISTGQQLHSLHLPAAPLLQSQDVTFLQPTLNPTINVAQHQYPIHVQQFLPAHNNPALIPSPPLPLGASAQKPLQSQSAERLVLTHNQRQYIRYVVVTDCDTGIKYTVGIKHVLNTMGSSQLVQQLEKNIGSEYKKGSSKRVCKSVVHEFACPQGTDCPFIHVTQEGWEARRKFSSANQKRNKDALGLPDTASPLTGPLADPGLLPFAGPEAARGPPPHMLTSLGAGWAPPATPPVSLGMFARGGLPLLSPTLQEKLEASLADQPEGLGSHSAGPRLAVGTAPRFPVPISTGFPHIAGTGIETDLRLHGTVFGNSNPIPFATQLPLHQLAPNALGSSSSSAGADVRTAQESSAASTSSSIGAISSCSFGSPLASPLIESIATAELPEPLTDPPSDFAEASRMIPYFNLNNFLGSLGAQE